MHTPHGIANGTTHFGSSKLGSTFPIDEHRDAVRELGIASTEPVKRCVGDGSRTKRTAANGEHRLLTRRENAY